MIDLTTFIYLVLWAVPFLIIGYLLMVTRALLKDVGRAQEILGQITGPSLEKARQKAASTN